MKLFLTSFLVLPSAVIAIAVTMPAQTNAAIDGVHRLDGWTPVPTEKPVAHFGLMRRQAASGGTVIAYAAQDNTCGYVQGKLGTSIIVGS